MTKPEKDNAATPRRTRGLGHVYQPTYTDRKSGDRKTSVGVVGPVRLPRSRPPGVVRIDEP